MLVGILDPAVIPGRQRRQGGCWGGLNGLGGSTGAALLGVGTAMVYPTLLAAIGDVAIFQANPAIVWAGTGENNNRQSSSWGDGVFKSTDGGVNWSQLASTAPPCGKAINVSMSGAFSTCVRRFGSVSAIG